MTIRLLKMTWDDSDLGSDDEIVMFDIEELSVGGQLVTLEDLVTNFTTSPDYYTSRLPKLSKLGLIEILS